MLREVSERKAGDETQRRLAAIVESSDDAIYSLALDGTITSWNHGAERLLGFTATEVVGGSVLQILGPGRAPELPGILARLARGESMSREDTLRRA